jgi:hypothetical protein
MATPVMAGAPGVVDMPSDVKVNSLPENRPWYVGDDAVFASRPWRTSPPLEGNGLSFGDHLDDPRFPIVATR